MNAAAGENIFDIVDFISDGLGDGKTHVNEVSDLGTIFQKSEHGFHKIVLVVMLMKYLVDKLTQDSSKSKRKFLHTR